MSMIARMLIGLAALGFVLAVCVSLLWPMFGISAGISAEGFSRASNNLALIAIALLICSKRGSTAT